MMTQMFDVYILFVRAPLLALMALVCFMGVFSKRGVLDWQRMVVQNNMLQENISRLKVQNAHLEREIDQLQKNPEEQERVVRQVLGYIRPNETVIEFP